MLFQKNTIGLEITPSEIRFALLDGKQKQPRLDGYVVTSFADETIRLSIKDPNVIAPERFVSAIRESYLRLLTKQKHVSVSLPDTVGRVMLVDLEARFRNREEGIDLIRWKLKKSIPFEINDLHLDYHILREKETGEVVTLVAFITKQVITQYEDLLAEAGILPSTIDFSSFNRYRLFGEVLEHADYSALIGFHGRTLSILIFNGGVLEFMRTKEIGGSQVDSEKVFREINSTLLVYKEKFPGHSVSQICFNTLPDDVEMVKSVIFEAFGSEPVLLLAENAVELKEGLVIDRATFQNMTAAIGAALRNV